MPSTTLTIRDATASDAERCAAIYAPYVESTVISFEAEAPDAAEMRRRIEVAQRDHAWLVLEDGDGIVGYAYGGQHHPRAAYRWACEVSVYLEMGRRRTGAGRALYEALLPRLAERGFRTAVAGMTEPNEASAGLHRALGFAPIGTYRDIGFKHDSWHDVTWLQRPLGDPERPLTEPG